MTIDRPTTLPPRWAESLLRMLLKPDDRESVSGDLLEEYRESIVPALGRNADRWYVCQVGWYVLRASWVWGTIVGSAFVTRYLFDAVLSATRVAPDHAVDFLFRTHIMNAALVIGYGVPSARTAWRTASWGAGMTVALATSVIGALIIVIVGSAMLVCQHDAATMWAWENSGGVDEALVFIPMVELPIIGAVYGTAGALVGRYLARPLSRVRRQA